MLFADEDENVVVPDAADKFDELLTRWPLVCSLSRTLIASFGQVLFDTWS